MIKKDRLSGGKDLVIVNSKGLIVFSFKQLTAGGKGANQITILYPG